MPIAIISTLAPANNGGFATHDSAYGLGGWVSVINLSDMYAISPLRLRAGMACRIVSLSATYILNADVKTWVLQNSSNSSKLVFIEQVATVAGVQTIVCDPNIIATGYSLYINGLLQISTSYTLSSNTVTIPATSNVVVGDILTFYYSIGA